MASHIGLITFVVVNLAKFGITNANLSLSEPNRYIRINTLRATVAEAKAALTSENVKFAES